MSQAKQIETPYGNVWIEKIAFSRTREQLQIYAHTDKDVYKIQKYMTAMRKQGMR